MMEFTIKKDECYIKRCKKDHYELYHILKDSSNLENVLYESVTITPEQIVHRDACTCPEPFHCSSLHKVSSELLKLIQTECQGFENNVKLLLDAACYNPHEKIAKDKCFTANLKTYSLIVGKVLYFEEINDLIGIVPVYELEEPGGEVHGEYIVVGNYNLHQTRSWVLYDEVFTDEKRNCRVFPASMFNTIKTLMVQRIQYIWTLVGKFLDIQQIFQKGETQSHGNYFNI